VKEPPQPKHAQINSFNASETQIKAGTSVRLCYVIADAQHASLMPIRQDVPPEKDCIEDFPKRSITYVLTAVGEDKQPESRRVSVQVIVDQPQPKHAQILQFNASETRIKAGAAVRLCYATADAQQASLAPIRRDVPPEKDCIEDFPQKSITYVLTAVGEDKRPVNRRVTVEVEAERSPPKHARILQFNASETRIKAGASVRLCYATADAQQASLTPIRQDVPPEKDCIEDFPQKSITYVLTAVGEDKRPESRRVSVQVIVDQPPLKHARILEFNASETRITAGASVRLCYVIADAERASLNGRGVSPEKDCISDSPKTSARYVLRATGEDKQTETRTVSVRVDSDRGPDVPQVRIVQFAIGRVSRDSAQLCYEVQNASSALIEPDFGQLSKLPADCLRIRSREPRTYTLIATGQDGKTARRSVPYTPSEGPRPEAIKILSFTPPTQTINAGAATRICYSTQGEGTAQISPEPGSVPPSPRRCVTVSPKQSTVYTLTVIGPQGQRDSRSVTVRVRPGTVIR
jgi:hypothetical protein